MRRTLYLLVTYLLIPVAIYSQCLTTGGIGSFESATPLDAWFSATEGNGTFQVETTEVYTGSNSLKVDITTYSGWQVRMFNKPDCYFDFTQGETYLISLYIKGNVGANVTVTLMDNLTNDALENFTLTSSDWTAYTISLTALNSSVEGRLKLNFKDVGTYYVDDISLRRKGHNWHVSPSGINSLANDNGKTTSNPLQTIQYAVSTAWQAGDTILVMNGTYQNANYGSGNLNNGAVVSLTGTVGEENGWLIIKNYPGHQPKLQFDGSGGFIGGSQTYLEIAGFEIEGPNQSINYTEAFANRLIQDNYYSGRGIAIWSGHHLYIHDNLIHDCPNSAIRANNADYCTIDHNEVYNNTWWSSNAESAIVYAQAQDIDTLSIIKMKITYNLVYDNINFIPYYNSTYTGETSDYGTVAQDYIIDGSGVYVTRNRDTYFYGWSYFANNVCYGNGINGLVVHKTDRAIVTNNTSFMNGAVPLSSGRQASSGITVNGSAHVRLYNNISWPKFDTDGGYKIYNLGDSEDLIASNNILVKGLSDLSPSQYTVADPLFVDTLNRDFRLLAGSPAIDAGLVHSDLPIDDYAGMLRDALPDLGAYEYAPSSLNARVLLGGAYEVSNSLMTNTLGTNDYIPTDEPYQNLPNYTYPIAEMSGLTLSDRGTVLSITGAGAIVDWVFVEIRDALDPSLLIAARAALVTRQGAVVDVDGVSVVELPIPSGDYHVVIRHRNHLAVMTSTPVSLGASSSLLDFTDGNNSTTQILLESGKYGLYHGDVSGDETINASDRSITWNTRNQTGYLLGDANLDGAVNAVDRSITWNNRNNSSQIP